MHGVPAKSLDVNYIPQIAVRACEDSGVVRLTTSFWKEDRVMQHHLHELFSGSWCRGLVFLRTLLTCGWRRLGRLAGDDSRDQLAQ